MMNCRISELQLIMCGWQVILVGITCLFGCFPFWSRAKRHATRKHAYICTTVLLLARALRLGSGVTCERESLYCNHA